MHLQARVLLRQVFGDVSFSSHGLEIRAETSAIRTSMSAMRASGCSMATDCGPTVLEHRVCTTKTVRRPRNARSLKDRSNIAVLAVHRCEWEANIRRGLDGRAWAVPNIVDERVSIAVQRWRKARPERAQWSQKATRSFPDGACSATSTRMRLPCSSRRPTSSNWPRNVRRNEEERSRQCELAEERTADASIRAGKEAGEAYEKLAKCHESLDSRHEVGSAYADAATAYKKVSPKDATRCLRKAVEAYMELGRLTMAAKYLRDIGEIQESEGNKKEAIEALTQAADLYAGEDSIGESNRCNLKVAAMAAEEENYSRAVSLFESAASSSLDNNLLKYSAKGYLLNAGICLLCMGDPVEAQMGIEKYEDMDVSFSDSRECKLLRSLAQAMEEGDSQAFTDAVAEYDSLSRLDAWKTTMLLRCKKTVSAREAGEEEEDLT